MNDSRFIKRTLYALKRQYGAQINIVWRTGSQLNLELGTKTVSQDSVRVDRAIILPVTLDRDFVYDLSFIASNKNFTYGALFNKNRRKILLDSDDLPTDFKIEIGYFCVINDQRFEIKTVDNFGNKDGYEIDMEQVDNIELANNIVEVQYQEVYLVDTVEVTVNA